MFPGSHFETIEEITKKQSRVNLIIRFNLGGLSMELQYIRYFLAICEQRSFVRAARQCGVSQPSLSGAIKRFERELGGPLFRRAERPQSETLPTDLALAIKAHLESALKHVEEAEQIARRAGQAALQHANGQKAADWLRNPSEHGQDSDGSRTAFR